MNLVDTFYRHYEGRHRGIWYRRGVIAANGLKSCLAIKWMRHLILVCWMAGLIMAAILFFMGQLLVTDSIVVRWLGSFGNQEQAFVRALMQWLEDNPQISVRTTENLLFYFFSVTLLPVSLVAVAIAIPQLVTRDLASNAAIVYASKALNRFDYFLGKWLILMGLMSLTWLGPLMLGWFLGNLLAPHWHFFWHARSALLHTLAFVGGSMAFLSLFGLAVSAVTSREKLGVGLWLALWLLGGALVQLSLNTSPWLQYLSFSHDLEQVGRAIYPLKEDLALARDHIPVLGQMIHGLESPQYRDWLEPDWIPALCGLGALATISVIILLRKVRPE